MALTETTKTGKSAAPCPWGNVAKASPIPCSFSSLMDEEYAKQIEEEETKIRSEDNKDETNIQLLNKG